MRVQRLAEVEATEYARLMQRSAADVQRVLPQVQAIMEGVRQRGDAAVREFAARFDGVQLHDIRVSAEERAAARQQVAQALAAMAFGTETVPRVYKLFGPGSIYVVAAKIWAASAGLPLAIDCPPGPSEVLVIADETAPAAFVAADLLSQAEHGEDSAAILLTTSERLAHEVAAAVAAQIPPLPTAARIEAALERYGRILVLEDLDACVRFSNDYAPEYLEIMTADPWALSRKIVNAGSVFLGHYSPVTMGDYLSGTNHVIPTGGYARMFSPLSVDEFVKKLEVQELTRQGLQTLQESLQALTAAEGFAAHQHAVDIRFG